MGGPRRGQLNALLTGTTNVDLELMKQTEPERYQRYLTKAKLGATDNMFDPRGLQGFTQPDEGRDTLRDWGRRRRRLRGSSQPAKLLKPCPGNLTSRRFEK